ncbi:RNA-binding protein 41 isoform X4 [Hydra vulgaris]|uniref:RNA-binding protein 41 isoform X4 n=1 Tax=Hydra vulgaris TaxID=6087 RepID=A0ABM4BXN0_HYDVU
MNAHGKKRRAGFGEAPTEKYMTLVDEQIKSLVKKQLHTDLSLKDELEKTNKFTESVLMKDESHQKEGIKSLKEFQIIDHLEEEVVLLREAGLTEKEIKLKFNTSEKISSTLCKKLDTIDQKLEKYRCKLAKRESYNGTISVSRKIYELNQATYSNSTKNQPFRHLVQCEEKAYPENDPVALTLKENNVIPNDLSKNKLVDNESENDELLDNSEDHSFVGPLLAPINQRIAQVPESVIKYNQIDLMSILSMEKFKNYKAGSPTRILYIKNLSKNIKESNLAELFGRFCVNNPLDVKYQVMKGLMRGQAFVTFLDEHTAQRALLLCNGYILNGRPMIIAFGKSKI